MAGATERAKPGLHAAHAHLLAWAAAALVQALMVTATERPGAGIGVRAVRHLFETGQLLAAGFVAMGAAAIAAQLEARLSLFAARALGALAVGAGFVPLLWGDLSGLAALAGGGDALAMLLAAVAGALLSFIPALARRLAGTRARRAILAAAAAALFVANPLVLRSGYPGIHLYLVALGASGLAGALTGAPLPSPRGKTAVYAALALAASASLVWPPSGRVLSELLGSPGAVIAPLAARARQALAGPAAVAPAACDARWCRPGAERAPVPPTQPALWSGDRIVLLFTVDALRADLLSDPRHAAALPNLTALAAEAVQFTEAYATSPATGPSITSIMTGKYYSELYWSKKRIGRKHKYCPHEDTSVGFPELLDQAGIFALHLAHLGGPTSDNGLARGFSEERVVRHTARDFPRALEHKLDAHSGGPLFVYGHFIEPHAPYDAPGADPFARYLGEVAAVDRAIGQILALVRDRGLEAHTAIVLSADHGEAFGEHGSQYHATTLYQELLRVPLLVKVPGVPARQSDVPVSIIDLGPTVLDLFGLPTPGGFQGTSLVPLLAGDAPRPERPIIADSGRRMQALVSADGIKVIRDLRHGTIELFDLAADPGEQHNLADARPDLTAERAAVLQAFFEVHTLRRPGYEPPYRP